MFSKVGVNAVQKINNKWVVYSGEVTEVEWVRDLACVVKGGCCGYPHKSSVAAY